MLASSAHVSQAKRHQWPEQKICEKNERRLVQKLQGLVCVDVPFVVVKFVCLEFDLAYNSKHKEM